VRGFKCFLSPSGVDEFINVSEDDLRAAMPVLAALGLPLLAHAEWPALLQDPSSDSHADPHKYDTWLRSRPPAAEVAAIDVLLRLGNAFGAHVHIVHLATPQAVPALVSARQGGVQVTVETCPHYLTFAAEEIADGATDLKCAPPIRGREAREQLWTALMNGDIDFIATDHSPAPPDLKHLVDGDFVRAWGGIASLQISLPVVWTGMCARGIAMDRLAAWLAEKPAQLAGFQGRKGAIAAGCDADLVVWDPDGEFTVDAAALYHRHPVTPYHGARLRGRVKTTFLRGQVIYDNGEMCGNPRGRAI
jgi:allantoinase